MIFPAFTPGWGSSFYPVGMKRADNPARYATKSNTVAVY
jgi:hypothetical protein